MLAILPAKIKIFFAKMVSLDSCNLVHFVPNTAQSKWQVYAIGSSFWWAIRNAPETKADENAVRTHNFHARIRVSAGERGALIFLLAYFRVFASHVYMPHIQMLHSARVELNYVSAALARSSAFSLFPWPGFHAIDSNLTKPYNFTQFSTTPLRFRLSCPRALGLSPGSLS
jgi:hypothetical protein